MKHSKAKPAADGGKRVAIAIPSFGYKNHIGIDGHHRLIRTWTVTDAARYDGAVLPDLLDATNTASKVWADTAYRGNQSCRIAARRVDNTTNHAFETSAPCSAIVPASEIDHPAARKVWLG